MKKVPPLPCLKRPDDPCEYYSCEKRSRSNQRQSRPASTPKLVNQTENSIGYRRILLEYQVQGLSTSNGSTEDEHHTHKISPTNSQTVSTRCKRSSIETRNFSFLANFYLSFRYRSFFVSQTKHADVQRVRLSWSLARDREAVVRENQSNHAGTLFTRGRENPIKRREIPLNEEDSSSSRAMNARG